jgi:predicted enzyme related to lactoylglutathione lyase
MANVINWFEIPAKNFSRACKFYEQVLGGTVQVMALEASPLKMGFLPGYEPNNGVGGAIITGEGYEPSAEGSVVYLNGGEDLGTPLSKVEQAGGTILVPKTEIGENGFFAHFLDTEGNRVALHSMN